MMSQESSHGAGERGELVHTLSKETPGSPDASELGSPRCTQNFDLFNMVVSYKRMTLFLKPVIDAVELSSFLLGCVCMFVCVLFEHHITYWSVMTGSCSFTSVFTVIPQMEDAAVLSACLYIS